MNNFQRRLQRDFSSPMGAAEPVSDIPEGQVMVADKFGGQSASAVTSAELTDKLVTGGDSHDHSAGDGDPISYGNLTDIPAAFTPDTHEHSAADITSGTLNPARFPVGYSGSRQVVIDVWDNGTQLVKRVVSETWVNGVLTVCSSPSDILIDTFSNVCPTTP